LHISVHKLIYITHMYKCTRPWFRGDVVLDEGKMSVRFGEAIAYLSLFSLLQEQGGIESIGSRRMLTSLRGAVRRFCDRP
jgi:hypothetical protein